MRKPSEPSFDDEGEPEDPDDQEAEETADERRERRYDKIAQAILEQQDDERARQLTIGDLVLEATEPPGPNGRRNKTGDTFEEISAWLLEEYGIEVAARTLIEWRNLAHEYPAVRRLTCEEAGIPVSGLSLLRGHPDVFNDLCATANGEKAQLTGPDQGAIEESW
jgi:hypothetical protein